MRAPRSARRSTSSLNCKPKPTGPQIDPPDAIASRSARVGRCADRVPQLRNAISRSTTPLLRVACPPERKVAAPVVAAAAWFGSGWDARDPAGQYRRARVGEAAGYRTATSVGAEVQWLRATPRSRRCVGAGCGVNVRRTNNLERCVRGHRADHSDCERRSGRLVFAGTHRGA
jgi:hypothetical protein